MRRTVGRAAAPRCVFRVAAGPRIGFGHLMRARALARALGTAPIVSVRGGAAARACAARAGCIPLPGADVFDDMDVLVVDDPSPREARAWVARARRRGVLSVSIHDGGPPYTPADLVVDGSTAPARRRRPLDTPEPAAPATWTPDRAGLGRLLRGTRFCLITRPSGRRRQSRRAPRVLIALGGGTHVRRIAGPLSSEIANRCGRVDIRVAAGLVPSRLPPLASGRWIVSRDGLGRELRAADVAVVAGGVTLYEACAAGVAAIGVAVVPPQRPAIEACAAAGAIVDAGGPGVDGATAGRIAAAVARLISSASWRRHLSLRARALVDGRGPERVARCIRTLVEAHRGSGRG